MKYTVVTSFPISHWETYGERFLKSFIEFWPKDINLLCYCDGYPLPDDAPQADNIQYFDLLDNEDLIMFKERNKQFDGNGGPKAPYNFYMDAVKFSHKVYAQSMAYKKIKELKSDWMMWLDADSVTYEPITHDLLDKIHYDQDQVPDIIFLGRKNAYATCSSFISYNLNDVVEVFMDDFISFYNTDEVLRLQCFADNYVFDRLRLLHERHGLITRNLTFECEDLDAFDMSPFGNYIVHLKGNKKYLQTGASINFKASRYIDLCSMVKHYERKNILEIGTWNGDTACAMIHSAFEVNDTVHYTGIDLFEEASEHTDKEEFNVKRHYTKRSVELKLIDLAKEYEKKGKTFTYYLMKGNSKEKLKILKDDSLCNLYNIKPDFVFIDGGHSTETVRSDYEMCKDIPVIVMDDYYTEDDKGNLPSPEFMGVNAIYEETGGTLRVGQQRRLVISAGDKVSGGGLVNLAVILNEPDLSNPPDTRKVPVQVQPRDCVPPDNIQDNVRENLELFSSMVERCHWHDGKIVLASAGPSLIENIEDIRKLQDEGAKVVCVKHSHNLLIENGIIPWGCVILDPRPFDGVSTHGIVRKDLLNKPHPDIKYFIASMTNIEVTKHLVDKGATVIGWHAFTTALMEMDELKDTQLITGGTCSAMRSIGITHTLGFREFHIFGMDCSYDGIPEDLDERDMYGKKKWLKIGILNEKTKTEDIFYTTGELLALAQDFESLLKRDDQVDMDLYVYGRGVVPSIFKSSNYECWPNIETVIGTCNDG